MFLQEIFCDKTSFNHHPNDEVKWARNPTGNFTTKTAYELVSESSLQRHNEGLWKMVWKIQGPKRVRVFMWKLLNNGVLTNDVRLRRHMTSSDLCPLCRSSAE